MGVWRTGTLLSDKEAAEEFAVLSASLEPGKFDSAVYAFHSQLIKLYPELEMLSEGEAELSPWASSPDFLGDRVSIVLRPTNQAEALSVILQLAEQHGLACFDAQNAKVYLPPALRPGQGTGAILAADSNTPVSRAESSASSDPAAEKPPEMRVPDGMDMLEGERILRRLGSEGVVLTTHRLCKVEGRKFSIMLEEIRSIEVATTSYRWLILLALVSLGASVYSWKREMPLELRVFTIIVTVCLVVLSVMSLSSGSSILPRASIMKIVSAGSVVKCEAWGLTGDEVSEFVAALDSARRQRSLVLSDQGPVLNNG